MSEVSRILEAIDQGDGGAAAQLLPLVYEELRRLAASKLARDQPGQTLQPTALVHEAYLRLVASANTDTPAAAAATDPAALPWKSRSHFFAAAAEAMRRILIERARRKRRFKHGGGRKQIDLAGLDVSEPSAAPNVLALDEALEALAQEEPMAAQVVKLRYFAGLTSEHAAQVLNISERSAYRHWAYAKAFLYARLNEEGGGR
jgi:RNA polymerase sigma factor (TIGR02999 family)